MHGRKTGPALVWARHRAKRVSKEGYLLILALLVFGTFLVLTPDSFAREIRATLAVMGLAIVLWVMEPIPMPLSSIAVIVALTATGGVKMDTALSGFSSGSVFLILAGFMMAKGVNNTPLGSRIAYILLSRSGGTPGGALMAILLALEVLAFVIPATAVRTALLLPAVVGLINSLEQDRPAPNVRRMLMLGLAFGANITGIGLLPGAIANVITAELLGNFTGSPITYLDWMLYAFPISLAMIPLTWMILIRSFPPEIQRFAGGTAAIRDQLCRIGPVGTEEKKCIAVLALTMVLWMTESIHGWHSSVPALLAVVLMCLPGVGFTSWKEISQVQWGTVLLVGTTLSLGNAMNTTGVAGMIAGSFLGMGWVEDMLAIPVLAVAVLTVFTQVYHLGVGNVATVTITLVPIVLQLAYHTGANGLMLGFATGLASLYGFVLVVEAIPNVMVYGTGLIASKDLLRPGIFLSLAATLVMALAAVAWWPLVGLVK